MKICKICAFLMVYLISVAGQELNAKGYPTDMPMSGRALLTKESKMKAYMNRLNNIQILPAARVDGTTHFADLLVEEERVHVPFAQKSIDQVEKIQLDKNRIGRYLDMLEVEEMSHTSDTIQLDKSRIQEYVRELDKPSPSPMPEELVYKPRIKLMKEAQQPSVFKGDEGRPQSLFQVEDVLKNDRHQWPYLKEGEQPQENGASVRRLEILRLPRKTATDESMETGEGYGNDGYNDEEEYYEATGQRQRSGYLKTYEEQYNGEDCGDKCFAEDSIASLNAEEMDESAMKEMNKVLKRSVRDQSALGNLSTAGKKEDLTKDTAAEGEREVQRIEDIVPPGKQTVRLGTSDTTDNIKSPGLSNLVNAEVNQTFQIPNHFNGPQVNLVSKNIQKFDLNYQSTAENIKNNSHNSLNLTQGNGVISKNINKPNFSISLNQAGITNYSSPLKSIQQTEEAIRPQRVDISQDHLKEEGTRLSQEVREAEIATVKSPRTPDRGPQEHNLANWVIPKIIESSGALKNCSNLTVGPNVFSKVLQNDNGIASKPNGNLTQMNVWISDNKLTSQLLSGHLMDNNLNKLDKTSQNLSTPELYTKPSRNSEVSKLIAITENLNENASNPMTSPNSGFFQSTQNKNLQAEKQVIIPNSLPKSNSINEEEKKLILSPNIVTVTEHLLNPNKSTGLGEPIVNLKTQKAVSENGNNNSNQVGNSITQMKYESDITNFSSGNSSGFPSLINTVLDVMGLSARRLLETPLSDNITSFSVHILGPKVADKFLDRNLTSTLFHNLPELLGHSSEKNNTNSKTELVNSPINSSLGNNQVTSILLSNSEDKFNARRNFLDQVPMQSKPNTDISMSHSVPSNNALSYYHSYGPSFPKSLQNVKRSVTDGKIYSYSSNSGFKTDTGEQLMHFNKAVESFGDVSQLSGHEKLYGKNLDGRLFGLMMSGASNDRNYGVVRREISKSQAEDCFRNHPREESAARVFIKSDNHDNHNVFREHYNKWLKEKGSDQYLSPGRSQGFMEGTDQLRETENLQNPKRGGQGPTDTDQPEHGRFEPAPVENDKRGSLFVEPGLAEKEKGAGQLLVPSPVEKGLRAGLFLKHSPVEEDMRAGQFLVPGPGENDKGSNQFLVPSPVEKDTRPGQYLVPNQVEKEARAGQFMVSSAVDKEKRGGQFLEPSPVEKNKRSVQFIHYGHDAKVREKHDAQVDKKGIGEEMADQALVGKAWEKHDVPTDRRVGMLDQPDQGASVLKGQGQQNPRKDTQHVRPHPRRQDVNILFPVKAASHFEKF